MFVRTDVFIVVGQICCYTQSPVEQSRTQWVLPLPSAYLSLEASGLASSSIVSKQTSPVLLLCLPSFQSQLPSYRYSYPFIFLKSILTFSFIAWRPHSRPIPTSHFYSYPLLQLFGNACLPWCLGLPGVLSLGILLPDWFPHLLRDLILGNIL